MSPRSPRLVIISSLLCSLLAIFHAEIASGQRRLHERVPRPNDESGPLVEQAAPGQNPAALRLPRYELPEPEDSAVRQAGESTFSPVDRDPSIQQLRQFRPDLQTGRSPQLPAYFASFQPSIAPYKRTSALDRIGTDYSLSIASSQLRELPVGGEHDETRDLFWGSVHVQLEANQPVPIPSVAPGSRILSVRARPSRPVRFYVDGADNYYVVSSEAGETRLVFVTDAPWTYFGSPVAGEVRASDVPAELRPSLPPRVARAAAQVASHLGLDPAAPVERNLTRLVTYLRSFRTEETSAPSGADPYLTLALGRRGVCRHRAFVFVVTAQALGLPARFVSNEVHAFAEVFVPTLGWIRIDLGGEGPLNMANNPSARHEPRSPDPFPWPPSQPQPRMARGSSRPGEGTPGDTTDTPRPGEEAEGENEGRPGEEGAEGREASPDAGVEGQETESGDGAVATAADEGQEGESDGGAPTLADQPTPTSAGPWVFLERHTVHVIRGEALTVAGRVEDENGDLAGARVTIWLTRGGGVSHRLGFAWSGPGGNFRAQLGVPASVSVGDYSIHARAER